MPVLSDGHAPGSRGELLFSTHPAAPVFNPWGRTFSETPPRAAAPRWIYRVPRRVTAHDAAATPPATVNTAGQAPSFLARGCEPAKAAT